MTKRMLLAGTASLVLLTFTLEATAQGPNRPGRGSRPARKPDTLKVGDQAPDFTLSSPDKKQTATLSKSLNDKPVALVFGSYT